MTRRIVAVAIVAAVAFLALVARDARLRGAWQEALAEPATRRALDAGLADIAEGRTRPWSWLVASNADDEPDWLAEYDPAKHVIWPYGGTVS